MNQKPENIRVFIVVFSGILLSLYAWISTPKLEKSVISPSSDIKVANKSITLKASEIELSQMFGLPDKPENRIIACYSYASRQALTLQIGKNQISFVFVNKRPQGLMVSFIQKPESKDTHLKEGDIITSINNELIDSVQKSFSAIEQLKKTTSIDIQIFRKQKVRYIHLNLNKQSKNPVITCFHPSQSSESNRTANLATLLSQVRIQPFFKDNRPQGFKLLHINKGSFFESIGVKAGDIITSINGILLDSMQSGYQTFNKLQNTTLFDIQIIRDNQSQLIHIDGSKLDIDTLWYCKSPSHYKTGNKIISNKDLVRLLSDAELHLHYKNGDFLGFQVISLKKDSLLEGLGVKPNDVIKSINGEGAQVLKINFPSLSYLQQPPSQEALLTKNKHSLSIQYKAKDVLDSNVVCHWPSNYNKDGSPIPRRRLNILLSQVRLQPQRLDNNSFGFKVFRVKKGSYIENLGVLPGDIITSIDGISIWSLKDLYDQFSKLLKSSTVNVVDVVIKRKSQTLTVQYDLNKKQKALENTHTTSKN